MAESRLEILYPGFGEQIRRDRTEGVPDAEIETRIHKWVNERIAEGYPAEDIVKVINPRAFAERPQSVGGMASQGLKEITSSDAGLGGFVRNLVRGFNEQATLGYADVPPIEQAATASEQFGRGVGEFAGGALPFVKGMQLAKAGRAAIGLGGKSALTKGLGEMADVMATGVGMAGAGATPSGGFSPGERLGAMASAATDPSLIGGAAAGGVLRTAVTARQVRAQRTQEAQSARVDQAQSSQAQKEIKARVDRVQADTDAETAKLIDKPVDVELTVGSKPETPKAPIRPVNVPPPDPVLKVGEDPYSPADWSNETLIKVYTRDVIRGVEHSNNVMNEASIRSEQDKAFRAQLRESIISASRVVEEAKRTVREITGTVGKKMIGGLEKQVKQTGELGFGDLTTGELNAAANELAKRIGHFNNLANPSADALAKNLRDTTMFKSISNEISSRMAADADVRPHQTDILLPENVQAAIRLLESKAVEGNILAKQAIAELRAQRVLSDATAKALGIQRAEPNVGPMVEAKPPASPPTLPKPPPGTTKPIVRPGVEPPMIVKQPATFEVLVNGQSILKQGFPDVLDAQKAANEWRKTELAKQADPNAVSTKVELDGPTVTIQGPSQPVMVNVYKGDKLTNQYNAVDLTAGMKLGQTLADHFGDRAVVKIEPVKMTAAKKSKSAVEREATITRFFAQQGIEDTPGNRAKARNALAAQESAIAPEVILSSEQRRAMAGDVGAIMGKQDVAKGGPGMSITGPGAITKQQMPAAQAYTPESVKDLADAKGFSMTSEVPLEGPPKFKIINGDGSVFETQSMKTATEYLMNRPDSGSRASINKAIEGKPLNAEDRREIQKFSAQEMTINPKETEAPTLPAPSDPINQIPPEVPPISGGAGVGIEQLIAQKAQAKGYSIQKSGETVNNILTIINKYPQMEAWIRNEYASVRAPFNLMNPLRIVDYIGGMPQFTSNMGIRIVTRDAIFNHGLPKYYEHKQWVDYYNKNLDVLTPNESRNVHMVSMGKKPLTSLSGKELQGYNAWHKFADDWAIRLGLQSNWATWLNGVIDRNTYYQNLRGIVTSWPTWNAVPIDIQGRFENNPQRFEKVKRAFEKNESYEKLPYEVRKIFEEDLTTWYDQAKYEQLPPYLRDMVPEGMWRKFSMTGGQPLIEDVKTTFRTVLPMLLDEAYTKPWETRWKPVWDLMPGNIDGLSTKAYLTKWWNMSKGASERSNITVAFDDVVRRIEDYRGTRLADPGFLDRLARRMGQNVYASTLGFALDTATMNLMQGLNNWAATGRVTRGISQRLMSSDFQRIMRETPGGAMLMEEFSFHQLGKSGAEIEKMWGMPIGKFRELDHAVTQWAMHPMHVAENVNRAVGFWAGMDEALAMGLDSQTATYLGFKKASNVVDNLRLSQAQQHALMTVAKAQFGYGIEFQSPYVSNPLAKVSTLFWSFPTKQLQFLANGIGENTYSVLKGTSEERSRLLRYSALTGLFLAGPILGQQLGINLENAFSPQSLFPRLATPFIQSGITMYNMILGRDPISNRDRDSMWRNVMHMLGVPGKRYGEKIIEVGGNIVRGYGENKLGQRMYDTTTYGELSRLFGIEYGRTYKERVIARKDYEYRMIMQPQRQEALAAAAKGDMRKLEAFNQEWGSYAPGIALTGQDVAIWARKAAMPAPQRAANPRFRRGVEEHLYGSTP